jgi:phytoene/squalene synthetase
MDTQDALAACAAHVERGDPDRFLAVMAAPPPVRAGLFALYAVNLEVARAPWVTKEPLLARMRLQFWRDLVNREGPPTHEFAAPLMTLIADRHLDSGLLLGMIDAREAEIGTNAPFADDAALWRYLDGGAGGLLALAVQALADTGAEGQEAAIALGAAQGLANYLLAAPALEAAGRLPLPDGRPEAIAALARAGLARIETARMGLRAVPRPGRPALLAAWRARAILSLAAREPGRVAQGRLAQSEFRRRGSLLWRSLVGM